MGFKLGSQKGNYAVNGEIKTKMRFSKEAGGEMSVPGVPVISKKLDKGIMGEANNDGSIFISKDLVSSSILVICSINPTFALTISLESI